MKITVVGGGSTYTPELADGLGRLAPWVTELVLVDPDQTRLAAVGPVSARLLRAHGPPAARRRATATRPGRLTTTASGRRPPGPAAWRRRCGPCPWFWTSPNRPVVA